MYKIVELNATVKCVVPGGYFILLSDVGFISLRVVVLCHR